MKINEVDLTRMQADFCPIHNVFHETLFAVLPSEWARGVGKGRGLSSRVNRVHVLVLSNNRKSWVMRIRITKVNERESRQSRHGKVIIFETSLNQVRKARE